MVKKKRREPKPGSFHGSEWHPTIKDSSPHATDQASQLERSSDLTDALHAVEQFLGTQFSRIYYPCCHLDVSPSDAFPKAEVIYLDLDESIITALQNEDYNARFGDALYHQVDPPVDLVILLNPQIPPFQPLLNLRVGGYIFVNDYHRTATLIHGNPHEYELVAGIALSADEQPIFLTDLTDHFLPVADDEEFARPWPVNFELYSRMKKQDRMDHLTVLAYAEEAFGSHPYKKSARYYLFRKIA